MTWKTCIVTEEADEEIRTGKLGEGRRLLCSESFRCFVGY